MPGEKSRSDFLLHSKSRHKTFLETSSAMSLDDLNADIDKKAENATIKLPNR